MYANRQWDPLTPLEGYLPVADTTLYYRAIGHGQPIIVLHGGPDFDHSYLLPDLDRLADSFHLIYYDQRGRGRSAAHVRPEDVTIQSEIEDIERLRDHLGLESVVLLGHSWGGVLAMEYAIRYPTRVSHLILMNTAFASHDDYVLYRQERSRRDAADLEELKARSASAEYQQGDPDAVADYYRVHFRATLRRPEHLANLIKTLRLTLSPEGILKAREIEKRLVDETWASSDYNLLPQLEQLHVPTLVIHGDYDFIPVDCAAHIAQAIPGAHFVLLRECGHFAYLECPDEVRREIRDFVR